MIAYFLGSVAQYLSIYSYLLPLWLTLKIPDLWVSVYIRTYTGGMPPARGLSIMTVLVVKPLWNKNKYVSNRCPLSISAIMPINRQWICYLLTLATVSENKRYQKPD